MAKKKSSLRWVARLIIAVPVLALVLVAGLYIYLAVFFDTAATKDFLKNQAENALGRELLIEGEAKLALGWSPSLRVQNVKLANAKGYKPEHMLEADTLFVQLALMPLIFNNGQIKINGVELDNATLHLIQKGEDKNNWTFESKKEAEAAAEAVVETQTLPETGIETGIETAANEPVSIPLIDNIAINKTTIHYNDQGDKTKLYIKALEAGVATNKGLDVSVNGDFNNVPFNINSNSDNLEALLNGQPWRVSLNGQAATLELQTDSTVTMANMLDINGDLQLKAQKPADVGDALDIDIAVREPFTLTSNYTFKDDTLNLKSLKATLGDMAIAGGATVNTGENLKVKADLRSDVLYLDAFSDASADETAAPGDTPNTATVEDEAAQADDGRVFPDIELPWSSLSDLPTMDIQLAIKELYNSRDQQAPLAQDVSLNLQAKNGQADIVFKTPKMLNRGTLTLDVTATSKGRVDAKADVFVPDTGQLLKDFEVLDIASEGKTDIRINLTGQGDRLPALMASLNGDVMLGVDTLVMENAYLKWFGKGALAALAPWVKVSDTTNLHCLGTHFTVQNGVMVPAVMVADTSNVLLNGTGQIDLGKEQLDVLFRPVPKSTDFANFSFPIGVKGDLADPSLKINLNEQAAKVAISAALAIINPLAAAIPYVLPSTAKVLDDTCGVLLKKEADTGRFTVDAAAYKAALDGQPAPEAPAGDEAATPSLPVNPEQAEDKLNQLKDNIEEGFKNLLNQGKQPEAPAPEPEQTDAP